MLVKKKKKVPVVVFNFIFNDFVSHYKCEWYNILFGPTPFSRQYIGPAIKPF